MTRVSIPLEAPLRHSYAVHGAFTRTVLQVFTDEGIVGLAETSAPPQVIEPFICVLLGEDPFNHERIRMRVSQRGYYSRQWLIASAFEIACWDIIGKACNVPLHSYSGANMREQVPSRPISSTVTAATAAWGNRHARADGGRLPRSPCQTRFSHHQA